MRKDDQIRVRHMIDAAETAIRFLQGKTRSDLDANQMLLFAVVRAVEIIGEAAVKLSDATRLSAPSVPWPAIIAMRNRLIHGYFDIDSDIVWATVTLELPPLLPKLRSLLDQETK